MPATRVLVVVALAALFVVGRVAYRRWHERVRAHAPDHPRLPATVVAGAARTWVVFTTPWCASCGPVVEQLGAAEPGSRVVTVDATREVALADAFAVRAAPTVLLADDAGEIQARLVGAESVAAFLRAAPGTAA